MSIRRTTTTATTALLSVPFQRQSDNRLLEDIFSAYYAARANKRNTVSQVRFERNLSHNLVELYNDILEHRYNPGRSMCFIIRDPVQREIFASPFRDRIIHHYLYSKLEPVFEPALIYDSYSCRKGKGTLFGIQRLEHHIRSCSANYHHPCFILKLDIEGYFMKIDRRILFERLMSRIDSLHLSGRLPEDFDYDTISFLLQKTVFLNPASNCHIKGRMSDWKGLPDSKSLFKSAPGCGLPIGNLTSQLFSNIYLNGLDQFCKREMGCRHYGRYVDDFFIVDQSLARLKEAVPAIESFLSQELHLSLNSNKTRIYPSSCGVPFLGAIVAPNGRFMRKRTRHLMERKYEYALCYETNPYSFQSMENSRRGFYSHFSCSLNNNTQ